MKLTTKAKFGGTLLVCALTMTACNRQESEDTTQTTDDETSTEEVVVEEKVPVVACDDQVALTQLTQAVKYNINTQTERLLTNYIQQADANLEVKNGLANSAVNSVLVDIGEPIVLQGANDRGMVTCQANLNLTVSNNDMNRANQVYAAMNGESLEQRLAAENISLNNNMLVANEFSYVVGMQGGQAQARVVGRPIILTAVSDIIAKSQYNAALEEKRKEEREAAAAARREAQKAKPRPPKVEERRTVRPVEPAKPSTPKKVEPKPAQPPAKVKPAPTPSAESSQTPTTPSSGTGSASANKPKVDSSLTAPTDDAIEMVIIEEEGTY